MDFSLSNGERNFAGCVFQGKEMCAQVKLQKGQNRCLQLRIHNSKVVLTLTTRYHIYGQTLNKVQLDTYLQNHSSTTIDDDDSADDDTYPGIKTFTNPPTNTDDYGYGS